MLNAIMNHPQFEILVQYCGLDTSHKPEWFSNFKDSSNPIFIDGKRGSGRTTFIIDLLASLAVIDNDCQSLICCHNRNQILYAVKHAEKFINDAHIKFENSKLHNVKIHRIYHDRIELDNGSQIIFALTDNMNIARGRTFNFVAIDSNIRTMDDVNAEFLACVVPCLYSTGGKLIITRET